MASQVAQNLGISESLIYKWKKQTSDEVTKGRKELPIADVIEENTHLRKELQRTIMERDILKKSDRRAALNIVGQLS